MVKALLSRKRKLHQATGKKALVTVTSTSFLLKAIFAGSLVAFGSQSILFFHKFQSDNIESTPFTDRTPRRQSASSETAPPRATLVSPIPRILENSRRKLPRVLAIVFPQFHPDPLNDFLWGKGFTDWDNLRAAPEKNRLGYEIPRPTELGYYDLRNSTVRRLQGELARDYGIDGFVFHHYWFYDKTHPGPNLHAPLAEMLKDGYPDIPFCLHWCDSKWTDTWHGRTNSLRNSVLQEQFFPDEDDPAIQTHYDWLKQFFHHENYIKVDGQPVFMVYVRKPRNEAVLRKLRELAIQDGFPGLYFTLGMSFSHDQLFPDGKQHGQRRLQYPRQIINKTVAYPGPYDWLEGQTLKIPEWCSRNEQPPKGIRHEIAGILTSFDNTPRRDVESAHLWSGNSPDTVVQRFHDNLYAAVYYETCCIVSSKLPFDIVDDDRFLLINSWNEWAEGMMMEPNSVFGRRFLETVRQVKLEIVAKRCATG